MAFHGFVGGKTVGGCTFGSPVPIWPGQGAYVAKAQNFQHPHDMHDCVSRLRLFWMKILMSSPAALAAAAAAILVAIAGAEVATAAIIPVAKAGAVAEATAAGAICS